jgi:UDP-N-acetylglucosamine 2-epimerase (non-hydrolysing)
MKLAIVLGTRPEIIRLAATIKLCRKIFDTTLIHTGQNYDYNLNEVFFKDLDLKKPDVYLNCLRDNCCSAVGDIITKSYNLFKENQFDCLLLLGDTNSAMCAYSAKRLKIPIFHLEGGNRAFDPNVPEEINRKIIDHLSDVNMCFMEHARRNLLNENCKYAYTFVVGSPIREVFNTIMPKLNNSQILQKFNLKKDNYIVWSVHREDNVDNDANFIEMINSLNKTSEYCKKKVIFGVHPRTSKKINASGISLNDNIIITEPFGLIDYYCLQQNASFVVSDSGTISEEANILKFKAILLRYSTERPECVDTGSIVLGNIKWSNLKLSIKVITESNHAYNEISAYADNNFSEKVCKIIAGYQSIVNKMLWLKN